MKKQLTQVQEFHEKNHCAWNNEPTLTNKTICEHRITIMQSEVDELAEAIQKGDMENITKELCDVLYVLFGTVGTLGLANKLENAFDEIHRSNMSKEYSGTPNSKAVKGKNYQQADIKSVLES